MRMRTYLFFPALTMSLGWGLRGSIGGGPFGAMIPGALVALALCILLQCDERDCGLIAAFGAVGVGFGGEMTYGQTVQMILQPHTYFWGLVGLSLKGAVWGLLGGAILGIALSPGRPSRKNVSVALSLLVAGTWVGWKFINEPKLIYFSNRLYKPRPEVWAGLLLGTLALLAGLTRQGIGRIPRRFALWGAIGGGIGFGLGGTIYFFANRFHIGPGGYSWWKTMELTFGFCFGLALGWCAWNLRQKIQSDTHPVRAGRITGPVVPLLVMVALILVVSWLDKTHLVRFPYALVGSAFLLVAFHWRMQAWHIAVTITFSAFVLDLTRFFLSQKKGLTAICWSFAIISVAAALCLVLYRQRANKPMMEWSFLFLTWTAVAVGLLKVMPGLSGLIFLTMALALTWIISRLCWNQGVV